MILTNRQIVWTPIITPNGVAVALDQTFANACNARICEKPAEFTQRIWELSVGSSSKLAPSNFLDMHAGSFLLKGIYKGINGTWLTLDEHSLSTGRPCVYHSHNAESAADSMWLLTAFYVWANGAMCFLEWE